MGGKIVTYKERIGVSECNYQLKEKLSLICENTSSICMKARSRFNIIEELKENNH